MPTLSSPLPSSFWFPLHGIGANCCLDNQTCGKHNNNYFFRWLHRKGNRIILFNFCQEILINQTHWTFKRQNYYCFSSQSNHLFLIPCRPKKGVRLKWFQAFPSRTNEARGLTQLQQVWRNRGTHSGERGTVRQSCVPDDRGRQLTGEYIQHWNACQDAKFTQQHQGQGDSWVTCREEGCKHVESPELIFPPQALARPASLLHNLQQETSVTSKVADHYSALLDYFMALLFMVLLIVRQFQLCLCSAHILFFYFGQTCF